jgi:hypothetical protein
MTATVANLIQGPGNLYSGAFGAAEPADASSNNAPPSTGAWTDAGGTLAGVALTITRTYVELAVDQIIDVPGRRQTKREFSVTTELAEATLANLALAGNNDSAASTAVATSIYEPNLGVASTQPVYAALIFDGFAPSGFNRRFVVRKALQTAPVVSKYSKVDQTVFTVVFEAHYVSATVKPFRILDQTA